MSENPMKHGLFFRRAPGLPFMPSNGEEGSLLQHIQNREGHGLAGRIIYGSGAHH